MPAQQSETNAQKKKVVMWLHILVFAVTVPLCVMAVFPPPESMSPESGLFFIVWLALVSGLAGYGLWKLP